MKTPNQNTDRGVFVRQAEGLYQYEPSKTYYARFRHKGKRIFERLGPDESPCTSLPEARRLLRKLRDRLEETAPKARKMTMHQLIDERIKTLTGAAGTIKYKKQYLGDFRRFFKPSVKVVDVTTHDLRLFLKKQEKARRRKVKNKKKAALAPATINHAVTVMREVFQTAQEMRCITQSPVLGIKYKKIEDNKKRLTPSFEQFEAIVQSIRSQKFSDTAKPTADLVEFMGLVGLGQAECKGLHWGEINFDKGEITIIRGKTRKEFCIPIYPQVLPLLERLRSEWSGTDPRERVFKVDSPKKALASACQRLGLPHYEPRSLRRMFMQTARRNLVPVQYTSMWQGHKSVRMVLEIYDTGTNEEGMELAKLMAKKPEPAAEPPKPDEKPEATAAA